MKDVARIYKKIVRALLMRNGMTQKELAEELGISAASISRALGRLESEGLVIGKTAKAQRGRKLFCIGNDFVIALVYPCENGFRFVSSGIDGSDRRSDKIPFRPELPYEDNCHAAVSETALRLKLLRSGKENVFLGVLDHENRHGLWRSVGASVVSVPSELALLVNASMGGTGGYIYADSTGNVQVAAILDGEIIFRPIVGERDGADRTELCSELVASLNADRVFIYAEDDKTEKLIADRVDRLCEGIGSESKIITCGRASWEEILRGVVIEKIIDERI